QPSILSSSPEIQPTGCIRLMDWIDVIMSGPRRWRGCNLRGTSWGSCVSGTGTGWRRYWTAMSSGQRGWGTLMNPSSARNTRI
uniref:Uncharacterized protein n=1 Tax=Aegilops tauschii subsp. strangulata TaxID=200361 RepID=A0A453QZA7_AEGTS